MLGLPGDANSRQARVSLLLLPIFGFPHRKIHIKKNSEGIQKIIGARKGCWNIQTMARNWLRRFKNTRIEI